MFYFHIDEDVLKKDRKIRNKQKFNNFQQRFRVKRKKKFDFILNNAFKSLKNKLSNKTTYYIHQSSGIPLMGTKLLWSDR